MSCLRAQMSKFQGRMFLYDVKHKAFLLAKVPNLKVRVKHGDFYPRFLCLVLVVYHMDEKCI